MKASAIPSRIQNAARPLYGLTAVAALGCVTLLAATASAQSVAPVSSPAPSLAKTQEVDLYVGEFFGDKLSDSSAFGTEPELDDDIVFGLRYGYNFTDNWGVELSAGYNPNTATHVIGGDVDFDLYTVDLNAVYHIKTGTRFVPYVTAGIGWVWADLDGAIVSSLPTSGTPLTASDDDSFSANVGVGVKYFVTDNLILRLDGRYRYIDGILDTNESSLDTVETTFGVGWVF